MCRIMSFNQINEVLRKHLPGWLGWLDWLNWLSQKIYIVYYMHYTVFIR